MRQAFTAESARLVRDSSRRITIMMAVLALDPRISERSIVNTRCPGRCPPVLGPGSRVVHHDLSNTRRVIPYQTFQSRTCRIGGSFSWVPDMDLAGHHSHTREPAHGSTVGNHADIARKAATPTQENPTAGEIASSNSGSTLQSARSTLAFLESPHGYTSTNAQTQCLGHHATTLIDFSRGLAGIRRTGLLG